MLTDLIKNDWDLRREIRELVREQARFEMQAMLHDELYNVLRNDYSSRQTILTLVSSEFFTANFKGAVRHAIECWKKDVENGTRESQLEFNDLFEPIHKAKDSEVQRAVKL